MIGRLRNTVGNLGHNWELYLTLAVCTFLLLLKILHVVEDHWVNNAILVTLMLLAIASLRDRAADTALSRTIAELASKSGAEGKVQWYIRRSDATPDMLSDMERFRHLAFLGISHRQLPSYLRGKLQHASGPLPWETIEVHYASNLFGEAYESREYRSNITDSRQQLAMLLTDPSYSERIPHFRNISFFQQDGITSNTGAMFGASPRELSVIYAVHSAVRLHGDTHEGLTIRLAADLGTPDPEGARFDHYNGIYRLLCDSSRRLGVFAPSTWDRSAKAWADYARQSKVELRSMETAAGMAPTGRGDSILDIGSGSGYAAAVMAQRNPEASIVLLDGSPQMVGLLRDRYASDARVRIALCQLPPNDWEDIDFREERFSVIVIHQSLGDLIAAFGSIGDLAEWCRGRLREDGRVVVAANNTLVSVQPPTGYEKWVDPFRTALRKKLNDRRHNRPHLREQRDLLQPDEVETAFGEHGFTLKDRRLQVIEMNYEDRRRLWQVPAVIDSMIEVREVWNSDFPAIVDEIVLELRTEKTMPRTMVFWLFEPATT